MSAPKDIKAWIKIWGIGLTGGIASGKTTVASMIAQQGFRVIDADQLAREVVIPPSVTLDHIIKLFGHTILQTDQTLDRKKLRQIVFSDPKKREALEAIMHPAIKQALIQKLHDYQLFSLSKPWFYEATLLCETGTYKDFKDVWLIGCDEHTQATRVQKRDQLKIDDIERILATQMPLEQKKQLCSVFISTDSTLESTQQQVHSLLAKLS